MIETRREERRFVAHVIALAVEEHIEPFAEGLCTAAGLNQSGYVVGDAQRVLCREGLVEEGAPPREIPGGDLRHRGIGNRRVEHLRTAPRYRVEPSAFGIAGHDIPLHVVPLIVAAPEVAPVARLPQIAVVDILTPQAFCHLCDTIVIVGILDGTRARTVDAVWDIAQRGIFPESAAPVFLVIGTRIGLSVLQHRLKGILVVDTLQSLHKGIGNHDLRIRAALRPAVAVAAAGIGHVALTLVDVQQRVHDGGLALGIEQGDKRRGGTIGVPDGIVVVVIRGLPPLGVFATLIDRHDQRMVEGCVEETPVSVSALNLKTAQQLFPTVAHFLQLRIKVTVWDIPSGLLGADIRDTYLYIYQRVVHPQHCPSVSTVSWFKIFITLQTEIDGISIAVIPTATNTGISDDLTVASHLHLSPHELLFLAPVRHRVLAKIVRGVNQ